MVYAVKIIVVVVCLPARTRWILWFASNIENMGGAERIIT